MTTPVNNLVPGTYIDNKVVAGATFSGLKNAQNDYAADFSQEFQAPINGQQTSSVMIRLRPELTLADMPASRSGLLARTGVTGGKVEIGLTGDKYFKVAVDDQGVKPGQTEQEVGAAGALAIIKAGNADLLSTLEANSTVDYFGATFGKTTKSADVWSALVAELVAFQEAEYTTDSLVVYIRPSVWAKLIVDVESLRVSVNPQETAKTLLGVSKVRVVNLASSLAVVAHAGAVAQARVLSGIRSAQEDFDSIVEGRIKYGTNILDDAAVRVLKDGTAPAGG